MKAARTVLASLFAACVFAVGCDRTISEERTVEKRSDGTTVTEERKTTQEPDGDIKKTEKKEVDR